MKYYLIAGEASGDLHGSNLMKEILNNDSNAVFRFYGGDKMQAVGGTLVKHYRELALMGILEALRNLRKFAGYLKDCKMDMLDFKPDVVILIDYAGFNLRIARVAKKYGLPVYYYIMPKLWAWGKSRAVRIRRNVSRVFVILPFEVGFYQKLGIDAQYFGNPVLDETARFEKNYTETAELFRKKNNLTGKPIIALLAGSRKQEIDLCLPEMVKVSERYHEYQFVVAGAPSTQQEYYNIFLHRSGIKLVYDQTYALLKHSSAAIVTSGTATLETALLNIPQAVLYKTSKGTFYLGQIFIALGIIHVKYFSLVNIILDKELVKEYLQFSLSDKISGELNQLLTNEDRRRTILEGYRKMKNLLGEQGASARVARIIVEEISGTRKS